MNAVNECSGIRPVRVNCKIKMAPPSQFYWYALSSAVLHRAENIIILPVTGTYVRMYIVQSSHCTKSTSCRCNYLQIAAK